jgi:hypothetical protein
LFIENGKAGVSRWKGKERRKNRERNKDKVRKSYRHC